MLNKTKSGRYNMFKQNEYFNLAAYIIYGREFPIVEPTCQVCGEILTEAEEADGVCMRHFFFGGDAE